MTAFREEIPLEPRRRYEVAAWKQIEVTYLSFYFFLLWYLPSGFTVLLEIGFSFIFHITGKEKKGRFFPYPNFRATSVLRQIYV